MSAADFLDSNVLVYALDAAGGSKSTTARRLLETAHRESTAIISFQVVQETLNVVGRKFSRIAQPVDSEAILREVLGPIWKVMPSVEIYSRALDIQARHAFSFYDSLIIAAALEAGCTRLFSEDLQHGQQIDGLTVENPFLAHEA